MTHARKGAIRAADIPADVLHALSRGQMQSATLAECMALDQAMLVAEAGIDIVQCEKFACELLAETVGSLRAVRDDIVILAAGGINGDNAAQFAATGVDVLVTSWPFFGKPADIKVIMEKIPTDPQ